MILKFSDTKSKVMLEYLRTIPNIVEDTEEGLVRIDFGKLSEKCAGLCEHLDTVVSPPYRAWHDLNKVYDIIIPKIKNNWTGNDINLTDIKIIKVNPEMDKLIAYLKILAKKDDTIEAADTIVFLAYIKDNIVKTFVDYLDLKKDSGVTVEWAVPPDRM